MQCLGDPSETLDVLLHLFGAPTKRVKSAEAKAETEWALSAANEKQERNRQNVLLRLETLPPGDEGLLCYVDWCGIQKEGRRPTEERVLRYINDFARPRQDLIRQHKVHLPSKPQARIGVAELLINPVRRLQQRLSSAMERPYQPTRKSKSWSTTDGWTHPSTGITYPLPPIDFSGSSTQGDGAQEVPVLDADKSMEMTLPSTIPPHHDTNTLTDSSVSSAVNTRGSSPSRSATQQQRQKTVKKTSVRKASQTRKKGAEVEKAMVDISIKDPINDVAGSHDTDGGTYARFRAEEFVWPTPTSGDGRNLTGPVPVYQLSRHAVTVPEILQEWRYGVGGGPSVQELNREFGNRWRVGVNDINKTMYDRWLAIVKEYVCLVLQDGLSNEKAIQTLLTIQGTSSLNTFYKNVMDIRRKRTGGFRRGGNGVGSGTSQPRSEAGSHNDVDSDSQTVDNTTGDASTMDDVSTLEAIAVSFPPIDGALGPDPAETTQPVVDIPKKRRSRKSTAESTASTITDDITCLGAADSLNSNSVGSNTDVTPQTKSTAKAKKMTGERGPTTLDFESSMTVIDMNAFGKKDVADGNKRKRGKQVSEAIAATPHDPEPVAEPHSAGGKTRKRAKKADVNPLPATAWEPEPVVNPNPSKRRGAKKAEGISTPVVTGDTASSPGSEESTVRTTRHRASLSIEATNTVAAKSGKDAVTVGAQPDKAAAAVESKRPGRKAQARPSDEYEYTPFPVRNLGTIADIWTEWTIGWEGEPSMESLVETHGRLWLGKLYKHQYTYFYCRERYVKAIRDAVEKGSISSSEEGIALLDEARKNLSVSHFRNHESFRKIMNLWGVPFARKRSKKDPAGPEPEPEPDAEDDGVEAEAEA
ncbi:hypothetical protein EMPS_03862 [Entomortierella parvispora]|uniref:Transcription activator GCR1-like domain-containing protein n=1 Tax=Entomortierella parvispora TaxID=205924 RepID=A0A9P3LUZ9_9FUNG|nr:hypothetical protein EMPS_03862 [Entomortierella parvispora]